MNDQKWFGQQQVANLALGNAASAGYWPKTAKDILSYAKSQAQQRRRSIQKELDGIVGLKEELANLDALIARLEGKEDE